MKLVELLARELKVWPEKTACMTQNPDKAVVRLMSTDVVYNGLMWAGMDRASIVGFFDTDNRSDDHATSIVTRADWEAEVARLASEPEQSPRERIKELHAIAIAVGMGVSAENPLTWRDRIREIDITVEALEEERAGLVQQLEDEGFRLIGKAEAVVEPVGDMSDWRNWEVGDIAEVISTMGFSAGKLNTGQLVAIIDIDEDDGTVKAAVGCWGDVGNNYKWHSRPST